MEQRKVVFTPSAFRHNLTGADIRWALENHLADGVVEDGTAMVFHVMKWRVVLGIEE
jgi:hypothetical protein